MLLRSDSVNPLHYHLIYRLLRYFHLLYQKHLNNRLSVLEDNVESFSCGYAIRTMSIIVPVIMQLAYILVMVSFVNNMTCV